MNKALRSIALAFLSGCASSGEKPPTESHRNRPPTQLRDNEAKPSAGLPVRNDAAKKPPRIPQVSDFVAKCQEPLQCAATPEKTPTKPAPPDLTPYKTLLTQIAAILADPGIPLPQAAIEKILVKSTDRGVNLRGKIRLPGYQNFKKATELLDAIKSLEALKIPSGVDVAQICFSGPEYNSQIKVPSVVVAQVMWQTPAPITALFSLEKSSREIIKDFRQSFILGHRISSTRQCPIDVSFPREKWETFNIELPIDRNIDCSDMIGTVRFPEYLGDRQLQYEAIQ